MKDSSDSTTEEFEEVKTGKGIFSQGVFFTLLIFNVALLMKVLNKMLDYELSE